MNIQQRYEKICPKLSEVEKLWEEELYRHKHLLSVSSSIGRFCSWKPEKIREYCISLGFNGAEIRFQNFENPAKTECLSGTGNFLVTAHLTDFAHWLYSSRELRELMNGKEIESYFGELYHQRAVAKRFLQELERAEKLGITTVTFHAAQIEFLGVLKTEFKFSDEEVIERVGEFIRKVLPQSSFTGRFGLENDAPYTRGMRLPEHFEKLLNSIDIPNVGITLDIAHLAAHSLKLEIGQKVTQKVWTVHLSEPSMIKPPKIAEKEIDEAAAQGFWSLRQRTGKAVSLIDTHNPVGEYIPDSKRRLDKIYQVNPELIVVHELKVPLELLSRACKLQQAQLVGIC